VFFDVLGLSLKEGMKSREERHESEGRR